MMENLGHKSEKRLVWGLVLIGLGIAYFSRNLNLIPWVYEKYIFTWQCFLFGIGLISFLVRQNKVPGLVMMAVGGFFFMRDFGWFPYGVKVYFWPVVLILIGVFIILGKSTYCTHFNSHMHKKQTNQEVE